MKTQRRQACECDTCMNFKLRLSLSTQFDMVTYANWVRDNATEIAVGFDRWLRSMEGDIHPSEQVTEASVYGRMQFSRAMGIGV